MPWYLSSILSFLLRPCPRSIRPPFPIEGTRGVSHTMAALQAVMHALSSFERVSVTVRFGQRRLLSCIKHPLCFSSSKGGCRLWDVGCLQHRIAWSCSNSTEYIDSSCWLREALAISRGGEHTDRPRPWVAPFRAPLFEDYFLWPVMPDLKLRLATKTISAGSCMGSKGSRASRYLLMRCCSRDACSCLEARYRCD